MNTWNNYYVESLRRQNEVKAAMQYNLIKSVEAACETVMTKLSIRMLDIVGSKLVQWGAMRNSADCKAHR